jgi:hypothetical protein
MPRKSEWQGRSCRIPGDAIGCEVAEALQLEGNPVNRDWTCLLFVGIAISSAITVPTMATDPPAGQPQGEKVVLSLSRSDFAARMAKVKKGMPERDVRKLLGNASDIRTHGELTTTHTNEIWCYGTNGHLTFPTLGCVYIDTEGKVQYIFGGEGKPLEAKLFREEELRDLLRLIDEALRANGNFYNPRTIIRIVNRLQPLGKEKALAVIDEYLRVASTWHSDARDEGLFVVLRLLFDLPGDRGYLARMGRGYPAPWGELKDPRDISRFAILLVDDVPLVLEGAFGRSGARERVETHVQYFRKRGQLRTSPLAPTNRPLAILDHLPDPVEKLYSDSKWRRSQKDDMLRKQLYRLIYSVYRKKGLAITEDGVSYSGYDRDKPTWKEACAAVDKLGVRWDAKKVKYTFPDGSTLPPPPRYKRLTWEIKKFDTTATLTIQRQDEEVVNFDLYEEAVNGPPVPQSSLRVFRVKNKEETLATFPKVGFRVPANHGGSSWQGRHGVELPVGQSVQVELKLGSKSVLSPIYKP